MIISSPRHRRLLLTVTVLTVLAWMGMLPAQAHDTLQTSSPADASTVPATPATVVLTFDQPAIALGTELVVAGPDGPVQTGAPRLVDNTVTQDLRPGSPAGDYTVTWRVTSADGHPISGTLTFTASAANPATAAATSAAPSEPVPPVPTATIPAWVWIAAVAALLLVGVIVIRAASVRRARAPTRP